MNVNFNYEDFISGEKFQSLADFEFLPNKEIPKNDCIIYCKTDYLKFCILEIEKQNNTYILISHNSDGNIVKENVRNFDYLFTQLPNNIKFLFAQNVKEYFDDRIIPIPIGFENSQWFPEINKRGRLLEIINKDIKKEKLIYINLDIVSNIDDRLPIYNFYKNDNFISIVNGKNGVDFEKYRDELSKHKFTICGLGNGIDSFRLLESLILKTIPICRDIYCFRFFKEKYEWQIYLVDDYCNLNYDDLNDFYEKK